MRIAIVGGGIAGLAAAYELELARKNGAPLDWHLYEASGRLGGIVETTRHHTPEGEWILEGGPDAWVSEKPWARDLAIVLGLESELIGSDDAIRKTYIYLDSRLQALPDRMRMMVPEDLATLDSSPLFSADAKHAYAEELNRAGKLKAESPFADPEHDESVATFVRRHFGHEVLTKVAGPLLSGVFGGDVEKLSVRAVMSPIVAMEQEHGSLIAALQHRAKERGPKPPQPIFTSLRRGVGSLVEALLTALPEGRLHLRSTTTSLERSPQDGWVINISSSEKKRPEGNCHPERSEGSASCLERHESVGQTTQVRSAADTQATERIVDHLLLATSLDATRALLQPLDSRAASLLPTNASSAVLAAFCWPAEAAQTMTIPPGFGFLVPPDKNATTPQLLAATFVDQKFPHRAPEDARLLRAFFGTGSAEHFADSSDAEVAQAALTQLRSIMGPLPEPDAALTTVRRWPRSLPQYEVGHLHRMTELDRLVAQFDGSLTLLGNSYRGVGLPDLIRDARAAACRLAD